MYKINPGGKRKTPIPTRLRTHARSAPNAKPDRPLPEADFQAAGRKTRLPYPRIFSMGRAPARARRYSKTRDKQIIRPFFLEKFKYSFSRK